MRLSYSAISTFNQCPQKYKWQYIERIKAPTTPDLFLGWLVHLVLEYALQNAPAMPPVNKLLELYNLRWNPSIFKDSAIEKEYHQAGAEMIKSFHNAYAPGLSTVLNVEKFFEIRWKNHLIVGKIDRIDRLPSGEIEIIDYKTNRKLPSESDFKFDFQLPLYQWAAQTLWSNIDKAKLTLYFLRHGKKITPENIKTLPVLQGYILETVEKINTSDFLANPSPLCAWCEYSNKCPEGQSVSHNSTDSRDNQPANSSSLSLGVGDWRTKNGFPKDSLFRDLN